MKFCIKNFVMQFTDVSIYFRYKQENATEKMKFVNLQ